MLGTLPRRDSRVDVARDLGVRQYLAPMLGEASLVLSAGQMTDGQMGSSA